MSWFGFGVKQPVKQEPKRSSSQLDQPYAPFGIKGEPGPSQFSSPEIDQPYAGVVDGIKGEEKS